MKCDAKYPRFVTITPMKFLSSAIVFIDVLICPSLFTDMPLFDFVGLRRVVEHENFMTSTFIFI